MKNPSEKFYTPNKRAEIRTHDGSYFRFYKNDGDGSQDGISLANIAHALALTNRFNGHTPEPYSVAQHSVLVSELCHPKDAKWGLLHDAAEAYIGDMPGPLKVNMDKFNDVERHVMCRVCAKYGLEPGVPASVNEADTVACSTEVRDLLGVDPDTWGLPEGDNLVLFPWNWMKAERIFLERAKELGLSDE